LGARLIFKRVRVKLPSGAWLTPSACADDFHRKRVNP
jgi:hypothetical protein